MAIRALGTGSKDWVAEQVVTVRADGTWAGTLDFSVAKPEEPFMFRVRRGGVTLSRVSGITERGRYVQSPTPTGPGGPTPSEPTPTEHQPPSPSSPTPPSPTATPPSSPTPSVGTPGPGTPVGPSEPPDGNGEPGEQPAFVPALPQVSDLVGIAMVVLVVILGLGATRISAVR